MIARLGTPLDFADSTAKEFGVDNTTSQKRNGIISIVVALIITILSFITYTTAQNGKAPEGSIGQADAMTNIQVESVLWFDVLSIIFAVGLIAAVFAVIQIIRTVCKNKR